MSPWSSGQDVALSRLNQGFDSPRRYQLYEALRIAKCFFRGAAARPWLAAVRGWLLSAVLCGACGPGAARPWGHIIY